MIRALVLACALAALPRPADSACRLALALGLDVSGSVDETEYGLQMRGLAKALGDGDVRQAIFALPDAPVSIAVYEWSASSYQRMIVGWTRISDAATLDALRARLAAWQRGPAPEATGLGAAMQFGGALLDRAPECWDQTLDISGDGKNNDWPAPQRLRAGGQMHGHRINALVVAQDFAGSGSRAEIEAAELSAYFRARVIQGADAFIEVALGFEDYAEAMRRKLLRELTAMPLGRGPGGQGGIVPVSAN